MNTTVKENLKNTEWFKVSQLQPGMQIAICDPEISDGTVWDEIVSIKSKGVEHVYDIEVEGTHNFVAGHVIDKNTREKLTEEQEKDVFSQNENSVDLPVGLEFAGIVAHNTYIGGNLGMGTTTPNYLLTVGSTTPTAFQLPIANRYNSLFVSGLIESSTITGTSTFAGGFSIGTAGQSGALQVLGNATSTFANGIQLTSGCFLLPSGQCAGTGGGGSGTVGTGAIGQIPYYAAAGTTLTATSTLTISAAQFVGLGTTTPQTKLHIGNASTTMLTSFDESVFIENQLEVLGNAYFGPMSFPDDGGVISWIDMPVSGGTMATGTVESYSARIGGTDILTVYALANGYLTGASTTIKVGVGTTTPGSMFAVHGNALADAWNTYEIVEMNFLPSASSTDTFETGELLTVDATGGFIKASASSTYPIIGIAKNTELWGNAVTKPTILGTFNLKVSDANGEIKIGDRLAMSSISGVAVKATSGGDVVGYALEDLAGETGAIKIYVNPQWWSGTTTPSSIVLSGEVRASGFINISTEEAKRDIVYLNSEDENTILQKIASTSVASYYYNSDQECAKLSSTSDVGASLTSDVFPGSCQKRLGLIAEEAPAEILSVDAKGVDIYKMASFMWAGMKVQQKEIVDLGARVKNLEELLGVSTTTPEAVESSSQTIISQGFEWVLEQFKNIGVTIADGVIQAQKLVAGIIQTKELEIGSQETPSGFTIYDKITKEPYCVSLENGEFVKTKGKCESVSSISSTPSVEQEQEATSTPPVEPPPVETPPEQSNPSATTTEPVINESPTENPPEGNLSSEVAPAGQLPTENSPAEPATEPVVEPATEQLPDAEPLITETSIIAPSEIVPAE